MAQTPCPVFRNAQLYPTLPAIMWGSRMITWEAFNNYVHSTSRYLKEISLREGMRVILIPDVSPAFYIVLMSLWRIGAVVCPLPAGMSDTAVDKFHTAIVPDFIISPRHFKRVWARGVRWADIEHVVAYVYNDSFLGSDKALEPMIDSAALALISFVDEGTSLHAVEVTHEALSGAPGALGPFFNALLTAQPFILRQEA